MIMHGSKAVKNYSMTKPGGKPPKALGKKKDLGNKKIETTIK